MENDNLDKLWEVQADNSSNITPQNIIAKAKKQRNGQYINITVMSLTVIVLITYAFYYAFHQWNTFNLGLVLMIGSLIFRVVLEFFSLYRKEKQLISMPQKSYYIYLKKYYKTRLLVNYIVTPICIAVYIFGFYLLLPYFKQKFSSAFYNYILISGIFSLTVVIIIIVKYVIKEQQFLKQLQTK